jgi:hypothetical protein
MVGNVIRENRREKMIAMKIEVSKFQFDKFTSKVLEFIKKGIEDNLNANPEDLEILKVTHPSVFITRIHELGRVEWGPKEGRSNFLEELHAGLQLFFQFSSGKMGKLFLCVDGKPKDVSDETDFRLGDNEDVGFLVEIERESFIIKSAIYEFDPNSFCRSYVRISDCGEFEEPMEDFIKSFILTR